MPPARIYSLDYLRGLTAFGIMVFHFTSWTFGGYGAEHFLGRVGLYGVSVFYILSGLTLTLIYFNTLKPNRQSLASFFIKRVFRIFPLLWLTIIATILITPGSYDVYQVFLSLTGLFGFIQPADGIGTGVWSIGNELVFYAIFPFLILLTRFSKFIFILAGAFLIAVGFYFAFFVFQENRELGLQWDSYVNPLNQVVLFAGGVLLGYAALKFPAFKPSNFVTVLLLAGALLLFIFYPAAGDRIALVSGWNRVVFIGISFIICASVYFTSFHLPGFLHAPLSLTGEISYGLYLLHPLVFKVVIGANKVLKLGINPVILLALAFAATFVSGYIVFRFFETPLIKAGKNLNNKLIKPAAV